MRAVWGQGTRRVLAFGATVVVALLAPIAAAQAYEAPTGTFASGAAAFGSGVTQTWSGSGATSRTAPGGSQTLNYKGYASTIYSPAMSAGTQVQLMETTLGGCPGNGTCSGLGTLTVAFSQPVLNPVIHLGGLGGYVGSAVFHDTFTLVGGGTLTKVGSGTNFTVSGNTITATNDSTSVTCDAVSGPASALSACGSVRLNGLVSSATFNVGAVSGGTSGTLGSSSIDEFSAVATIDSDFGDAPTSIDGTTDGARHAVGGLKLGSSITPDATTGVTALNPTQSPNAGASATGDAGDDGVNPGTISTLSSTYSATVALAGATKAARLCGWVDFNKNNNFQTNAVEQSCVNVAAGQTTATLNWSGLSGLTIGTTYARFRLGYTDTQITGKPNGPADSGEVEDYQVAIITPAAPTASSDAISTPQNVNKTVDLLANDSAVLGLNATTVVLRDPADNTYKKTVTIANQGTWTVDATTGIVTFNPVTAFVGNATTLAYRVADTAGRTTAAQLATTVTAVTPVASNDSKSTAYNTATTVDVLGNDNPGNAAIPLDKATVKLLDPADGTFKTAVTVAGKGTFTVDATTGAVTFTPVAGFVGTAGPLTYRVADANGTTTTATLTVTVALPAAPVANPDTATTPQNVNVALNPLTNDTKAAGVSLVPSSLVLRDPADNTFKTTVTIAGQGTYTVNTTNGTVDFDPVAAFTGNASALTYRITDSTGQNATSTIAVTVTPITPTAVDNSAAATFNTAVTIPVLGNDTAGAASAPLDATSVKLRDPADNTYKTGVTIAGKGTFTVDTTGVVTFTPVNGYQGVVGPVTYRVLDTNGTAATAAISVGVNAPAPPVAADDSATTLQGKPVTLVLLGNDSPGPTGAALVPGSVQLKDPATGTWKTSFAVAGQGFWSVDSNGAAAFTPIAAFSGTATSVDYRVSDANGAVASATARVTVTKVTPTAKNDSDTTAYEVPVTVALLGNDSAGNVAVPLVPGSVRLQDPADSGWKTSVTIAGQGTYALNAADGSVTFTPAQRFTGTGTTLPYEVRDTNGTRAAATLTVTVNVPGPPTANPDAQTTKQGVATTVDLLDDDTADTNSVLIPSTTRLYDAVTGTWVTTLTVAGQGTWTVDTTTGVVAFAPVRAFTGDAVQTYRVKDETGQIAASTVTVTVTPVTPVAKNDSATTPFAHAVDVTVLGNDAKGDDSAPLDSSSVQLKDSDGTWKTSVTADGQGTFAVQGDGSVRFTPADGFSGPVDVVTYRVADSNGTHASATIAVTVGDAPIARSDEGSTLQDVTVDVTLLGNDVAGTDATLVAGSVQLKDPADGSWKSAVTIDGEGTWTVDPATGGVSFDPVPAFTGTTTELDYRVEDSDDNVARSTVRVVVAPVTPVASNDTATTPYAHAVDVTVLGNDVKGDDSAPLDSSSVQLKDSDGTWKKSVTVDGKGTFEVQADGSVRFTPADGFAGPVDLVTYRVADDNGTRASATIAVTVGDAPVAGDDEGSTKQGVEVAVDLLDNDLPGTGATLVPGTVQLKDPSDGTWRTAVTIDGEGTWTVDTTTGKVTFVPEPSFTGTGTVTYRVADTDDNTAEATVSVDVAPVTPVAGNNAAHTAYAHPVDVAVLGNDAAGDDSAPLDASSVQLKDSDGTWKSIVTVDGQGTFGVLADGSVRFTPADGFSGPVDVVTYRVADENGTHASATITVTVGDAPVATDDEGSTKQGVAVEVDVLDNDAAGTDATLVPGSVELKDPSDGTWKTAVTVAGQGTWTVDTTTGKVTFAPEPSFTGTGSITYRVTDTDDNTDVATLEVTVGATTPVASPDSTSTPYAHPVDLTVLGNDAAGDDTAPLDASSVQLKDSDGTWRSSVTVDGQGTFEVEADGSVRFTPADGFSGPVDVVTYRVADANGTHATSTITATVGAAPAAVKDQTTTPQGVPVDLHPLGNDTPGTGADLDPSSLVLVDPVTGDPVATVVVPGEGTWTIPSSAPVTTTTGTVARFSPLPGFEGTTTPIGYRVMDSDGNTADATLTVVVEAVTPVAADDAATTPFATPVTVSVLGNDHAGDDAVALDPASVRLRNPADPADHAWKTTVVVPGVGAYAVQADGSVKFTPSEHFSGTAPALAYQVADVNGTVARAELVVSVGAPLGALAQPDQGAKPVTGAVTIDPLANDTPSQGATFVGSTLCLVDGAGDCVSSVTVPGVGTWVVDSDGTVTFTPVEGYTGPATIGYQVTDTNGVVLSSTISFAVQAATAPSDGPSDPKPASPKPSLPAKADGKPRSQLAFTGANVSAASLVGLMLLVAGIGAIVASRRRPQEG
ncbi:CshA-type fibril repeat-containing protein [Pedococcus dokdonensis]|uniref:CshA-type fibril repeat-containing protein n=1 Tax=Pedococcus dokdonensis TaxID=443156 RepID=A0A1H0UVK8_9MICO|nr:tandem-95 repeat protein [Pedococcus dokdonensis]SDP70151.1 CshA-type fibril repeat-containing protein [Pedococcus dokdonensis]